MVQRAAVRQATGRGGMRRLAVALLCALALPASAQSAQPTLAELLQRLEALERRHGAADAQAVDGTPLDLAALDQRLRALERNLELQEEARQAAAKQAPVASAGAGGAALRSGDGRYELRFRGLVQGDGRFFTGDGASDGDDTFLLRRVRPTFEGSLGRLVGFRLTPEFAGDSASLVDAYIDLKFDPAFTVRAGKVKGPVGLERLQSGNALALIERGFPTELAPNRELGVQAQGELADARFSYTLGVYNGAPDGRDGATSNSDGHFEYAGRAFFEPVKGIGFGVGGSTGDKDGGGNALLPRYRTQGQQQFFNYRAAVVADGRHSRLSPQGNLYRGPFGLQAEYIRSRQALRAGATRATLEHSAWQTTASWVLSGEDAGFRGVKPARPFDAQGGWGAFEVVARVGELAIDDAAFPLFADPSLTSRRAREWALGLNWYLNANLKLAVNYLHTGFDGGATAGADREDEKAVFSRLQVAF